jgi:3'-phosphoadenosine 5'-phosphosulfate sulfotransferase (PAPS reductase)/FAD synthetase
MARVARFFLVQHTKTGKNVPENHKYVNKMTTKYTNIVHCKIFPNLPKLGYHLATLAMAGFFPHHLR